VTNLLAKLGVHSRLEAAALARRLGLAIPVDEGGAKTCQLVVDGNAGEGVTWIHSYVTPDKQTTFCIYDGPSPEAIRRAAEINQLPVDRITEVRVLDPYFYS
jgi:hypothetical protein